MKRKFVLLIAMIFGVMLLSGCGKKVDLNKYVEVEITGYNGYGKATVVWNDEALRADFKDLEFTDPNMKIVYGTPIGYVKDYCVDYELSEDEGLENGDEIILKWDCNALKAEESASVKLKCSDIKVAVNELEEIQEFDAFELIELEYSGIAPDASVKVNNIASGDNKLANLSYTVDKKTGLKNGDVVTVSVRNGEDVEYMIDVMGGVPREISKSFKVEGVEYYANTLSEIISSDIYKKMDTHARDLFATNVVKNWDNPDELLGVELVGNYFLYPKNPLSYSVSHNYVDFVYKITAYDRVTGGVFDYYWYCGFCDIMVLQDGTVSADINNNVTPEGSYSSWWGVSGEAFEYGDAYYIGFQDLDKIFYAEVTFFADEYTYESTVQ